MSAAVQSLRRGTCGHFRLYISTLRAAHERSSPEPPAGGNFYKLEIIDRQLDRKKQSVPFIELNDDF